MKTNESRQSRKEAESKQKITSDSSHDISKVYYWIVGILLIILIGLVIFIFTRKGDEISQGDYETQTEESQAQQEIDDVETSETTEETESETSTDSAETSVNNDAPLDKNYQVSYADGSSDRVAIKNQVMQVTGLDNNLIEWWVGNNGPGRVETTVSNSDQSEVYRVYLQYGEGNWHVTNYEILSEVPANLR